MKKNILTLLSLFMITASYAQFTYGPKLGANGARLSGDKMMPGFQAGGFVNAELEDRIGIQIDFLWTIKGTKHLTTVDSYTTFPITSTVAVVTASSITTEKTYYRFVDLPICVYFPISKHIRGFAGPQISAFRKAHKTTTNSLGGNAIEKDIAGIAGKVSFCAGFDLNLDSPIIIGLRFTTNSFTQPGQTSSLSTDPPAEDEKKKLNCIMLNVAYRLDW